MRYFFLFHIIEIISIIEFLLYKEMSSDIST